MKTSALLLGTLSGLRFVAPHLEPEAMIATAVAVQATHAVICRVFAARCGRSGMRWALAGLVGGIVTVTALLLLIEREGE